MESKRKASVVNGASASEADERAAKRQRLAEKYDLSKQETPESTTEHGLFFLEQIRRTADKNGRRVAGYFETLLPREGNEEYYERTKMPISLEMVEEKLNSHEFANLTELESYFKRMVANAKEFYHRTTPTFEDAERVRKAVSNYMTKTNPAYTLGNYTATATPLPPDVSEPASRSAGTPSKPRNSVARNSTATPTADEPGEGYEDDVEVQEEDEEVESKGDENTGSRRASIILRRGPGRKSIGRASETPPSSAHTSRARAMPKNLTNVYEDVPYKDLTFQEAQEKIVEEMMRKREEFEDFVQLPSRSLRDYYHHIKQPMSISGLRKQTRGEHGRKHPTYVSDFKNWAAFEEATSLLWENAYFYNDDDSEIFALAQKLEVFCHEEIKKAKEVVDEPPQPKIKLKVSSDQPAPSSKKITILVGGRDGSTSSPAPATATAQSAESKASEQPSSVSNGTPRQLAPVAAAATGAPAADRMRSTSAASPSPALLNGVKKEDPPRPEQETQPGQPNGVPTPAPPPALSIAKFQPISGQQQPQQPQQPQQQKQQQQQQQVNGIQAEKRPSWDQKYRAPGKGSRDALIQNLRVQTHPALGFEKRHVFDLPPHEREAQQTVSMHLPANHLRIQIIPTMASFLFEQQRQHKLWVMINKQILVPQQPVQGQALPPNSAVFDAQLQAGIVNVIEVHVIAALPKGQRTPSGADVELEQFTVLTNVVRN